MKAFETMIKLVVGALSLQSVMSFLPADIPPILQDPEFNIHVNFGPGQWSDNCQYTPHYLTNNGSLFSVVNTVQSRTFDGFTYAATESRFAQDFFGFPPPTGLFNYVNTIASGWNVNLGGSANPVQCTSTPWLPAFSSYLQVNTSLSGYTTSPFNGCNNAKGPLYAVAVPANHLFVVNIRLNAKPSNSFSMIVNNVFASQCAAPIYDETFTSYCTIVFAPSGYIVIGASQNIPYQIVTLSISDLTTQPLSQELFLKNLLYGALNGNTTLITGASRGIGRYTAQQVASRGSNVCINYFQREEKATENVLIIRAFSGFFGPGAIAIQGDVGVESTSQYLLSTCDAYFNRTTNSIIVNAGVIYYIYDLLAPEPYPGYFDAIDARVTSTISDGAKFMSKAVLNRFITQPNPTFRRLFYTNSIASQLGSQGSCPPYGPAKGSALMWMKEFLYIFVKSLVTFPNNNYPFTNVGLLAVLPDGILTDLVKNAIYDSTTPPIANYQNASQIDALVAGFLATNNFYAGQIPSPLTIATLHADLLGSINTPFALGDLVTTDWGIGTLAK